MLFFGEELDPEAHLLSIQGPEEEKGKRRFYKRRADGAIDRADMLKRSEQLRDFLIAAQKKHALGDSIGVGFSCGANMLLHCMCMHPEEFSGAMLFRPQSAALPATTEPLGSIPVFIGAGSLDPLAPPVDSIRLDSVLRAAGAVTQLSQTNQPHQLGADDIQAARGWLQKLAVAIQ